MFDTGYPAKCMTTKCEDCVIQDVCNDANFTKRPESEVPIKQASITQSTKMEASLAAPPLKTYEMRTTAATTPPSPQVREWDDSKWWKTRYQKTRSPIRIERIVLTKDGLEAKSILKREQALDNLVHGREQNATTKD
jgi:hypothetical protein